MSKTSTDISPVAIRSIWDEKLKDPKFADGEGNFQLVAGETREEVLVGWHSVSRLQDGSIRLTSHDITQAIGSPGKESWIKKADRTWDTNGRESVQLGSAAELNEAHRTLLAQYLKSA